MTSDTATTILRENTSSTRDALMERKRNEIQIWERTYEQTHDRKPTRKDVEKNDKVRKMYREYKELLSGLTTKCTNSIQNNNTKNNNGKGGDFENFQPTAKEEYESDGDDEVIEATPPRKQQHIKQQHNKSFSKSSSLPSMVSSAEKKKNAAEAAADEASLFALKEEAKKKTKPLPVLPPPPPPSLVMRMKSNNNKGIIAGDFSSSSSFATIANKQKKKTCYEPLLCEEDERNRAKERFGALKRREMHAMENVSLTNALKEDVVVQPRKKKKLVVREEKRVVVGRAAAAEEEEEIETEKEDGNSVAMMREESKINNILSKTADDGGAKTTTTKLPPTFSPPKKTAAQIRAEHAKRFPEVGVPKKTAKFRGVSEHSRRKTYKAPRRRAGSAKRPPKVYTRDAARSGGSKHLNAERRERNAKGKTGKFSVGEGDDDLYSSKSKYDDDNDENDIEKNKLDALAAEKRKKLEELNDDTLQKYIADVRECLSPFAEKKGVQSMDDTNDDDDDNDDETAVLKEKLRLVLERGFGFPVFKPGQIDVILRVLRGANTLALLPTGAGKSLTYQLPALLLPGITLVISPLLALMSDQMRGLPPALKGACLRSDASYEKTEETLEEVKSGNVSILFVSPERLLNEKFLCALRECPNGVSLACIDEAHCVSEWSHNFRPAYHRLGSILFNRVMRSGMNNNNNGKTFPVLALTATATKKTEMSLRETLNIAPENALRNDAIRDNLSLSVIRVPSCSRNSTLLHFLQKDHPKGAAIVYVAFKNEAESVANYLKVQGVVARPYHAGLDKSERHRTQMQFQENKVRVIVATVAFGMGLDKPDVRYVINYALPRSPEAYIQQCGRAGRDGNEAHCLTFLDPEDYLRSRSLTHADGCDVTSIRDLMEIVFLGNGDVLKPKTTQKKKKKQVSEEVFRDEDDDIEKRKTDYDAYGNWIPKLGRIKPDVIAPVIDVKLEAIETALSCLELWGRDAQSITSPGSRDVKLDEEYSNLLRVLPDFRSTCEIRFFGRDPKEIAKQSTLVDAILKLCPEPKADGARIFDICKAAFLSNCSLDEVAFQLKALRDNREAGYEIRDRALGFEILRDPPKGDKLRKLAFDLTKRLDAVEKGSVGKLDALYAALDYAADAEADDVQGARLRESLKWYLNASEEKEEEVEEVEEDPSGGEEDVPVRRVAEGAKRPKCVLTEKRMLVADIREILTHRREGKVGGAGMLRARAVARILHGIGSPKYPAAEWRRGSSAHLWERHRDVDFYTVVEMCNAEILRVRGVVPTSDY